MAACVNGRSEAGVWLDLLVRSFRPDPASRGTQAHDGACSLAQIGFLVFLAAWCSQAFSQVDRSAYPPATVDAIVAQHSLKVGASEPAATETRLIAPEFKYRLRLRATGRIRELTPEAVDAIFIWNRMHADLPAFVNEYTQKSKSHSTTNRCGSFGNAHWSRRSAQSAAAAVTSKHMQSWSVQFAAGYCSSSPHSSRWPDAAVARGCSSL
jgi:hypothetical protein